jgi:hypothetical protein
MQRHGPDGGASELSADLQAILLQKYSRLRTMRQNKLACTMSASSPLPTIKVDPLVTVKQSFHKSETAGASEQQKRVKRKRHVQSSQEHSESGAAGSLSPRPTDSAES